MKKKIKRIFWFIFAFLILAVSVFLYAPRKVSASSFYYSIGEFYYSNHVNTIKVYATYDDTNSSGRWVWFDNPVTVTAYQEDDEFPHDVLIRFKWTPVQAGDDFQYDVTDWWYSLVTLNADQTTLYNQGYTDGLNEQSSAVYDKAFNDGVASIVPGTIAYDNIYDDGVRAGQNSIVPGTTRYDNIYDAGYAAALEDIGEDDPTFLVMFKSVINYFVDFFTVGLNVEIFGVNIGGFCIAIFMLSIMTFIVRFIFGR